MIDTNFFAQVNFPFTPKTHARNNFSIKVTASAAASAIPLAADRAGCGDGTSPPILDIAFMHSNYGSFVKAAF